MCRYVAILVYQGIIENVDGFESEKDAGGWLSRLAEEYGADNCAGSIIWDTKERAPIDLGFVSS